MKRFRLFLSLLLVLLFASSAFAGPFMVLHKRGSAWSKAWLTGWDYRKEFTATRESGAVTDYQVKILVGESSGATGDDVDCGGHVLSTFNDLRFTTSDGTTLISYWIESITGTTPNQLATVWVKLDSVGTSATTFYMYYGNSGASAGSNGANTFILFDHFDGESIDTDIWNVTDSVTITSSYISTNANQKGVYSKESWNQNVAIRARALLSSSALLTNIAVVAFRSGTSTPFAEWASNASQANHGGGVNYVSGEAWAAIDATGMNAYHVYEIAWVSGKTRYAFDNSAWSDVETQVPSTALPVELYNFAAGNSAYWDWVFVRNYRETEPVVGSWGSEES